MNILITGNLSTIAAVLAKKLARDNNKVVLASHKVDDVINAKSSNVVLHAVNPIDPIFRDVLSSYKFDAIVCLSTREEMLKDEIENGHSGQQLDDLRSALELTRSGNVHRFIYVSSTEVYGEEQKPSNDASPKPTSLNGHALFAGEMFCRHFQDDFGLNVTIVRVPNVYGPEERGGILFRALTDGIRDGKCVFPGPSETTCGLLHADDIGDFIKRIIDDETILKGASVNLLSPEIVKYSELSQWIKEHLPEVVIDFDNSEDVYTRTFASENKKEELGWYKPRLLADEVRALVEIRLKELGGMPSILERTLKFISRGKGFLRWGELILGAALAIYFSQITDTLIQFQYIDFRLLYVVIMGSIYGFQFGLYSSILMGLFVVYTWMQLGVSWELLVYNVGNWFPLVMYLAAGLITGYNHDKTENDIENGRKQYNLILEKYSFLYEVFNEVRNLKDEFRERLIGYRDSFGKIFTITQELDELQEHAVYFRALNILEELMSNKNIAIYSLDSARTYARLEARSPEMKVDTGHKRSLRLSDYPALLECIEDGKIFQNTKLLENYPAYCAPVFNNSYPFNVPVALVVIWYVDFEQFSTYYYNLFKVICGLIEASLLRATMFLDANYSKTYLPSTRILNREAFLELLKVRLDMKKNGVSDFQLLRLYEDVAGVQENYAKISMGIRSVDILGVLDGGKCYILLSQADGQASLDVLSRLKKLGIEADIIETQEIVLE